MKKIIIPMALCLFMSCISTRQSFFKQENVSDASDTVIENLQKEFMSTSEEDECLPWEEIIKKPAYQKLPDDLRQDVRNKYFDDCLMENIDDKDEFKEYYKFFISALEAEKRAGMGNYLNCTSGDCKNGDGTLEYYKGVKYTGQFKDGKRHGKGTLIWSKGYRRDSMGITYTGEFKDDLPDGEGTYTWANGDKYEGQLKYDLRNGYGTYTWADGGKYEGQWKDDEMHGEGIVYDQDGEIYLQGKFEYGEYIDE